MQVKRLLLVAAIFGVSLHRPLLAAEKPASASTTTGVEGPMGEAGAATGEKATPAQASAEGQERVPVKIQGDIPIRSELQVFQGVRGWLVNGQEIRLDDVRDRAVLYYGPYVLQEMVEERLLESEAKRRGVAISDQEVNQRLKEMRQEWGLVSDAAFEFSLRRLGYTHALVRQRAKKSVLVEKILSDQVYVSDREVAAFYEQFRDQYRRPESVDFRAITLSTEKDAQTTLAQIRSGKSFQQIAKELAPAERKAAAGELQTYARGQMPMSPELDAVLFTAPLNQVVGPIKSGDSYYLLRVEKKRDAYQFSLEETGDIIKAQLRRQKLDQGVWPNWVKAQLGGAEIETLKAQ